MLDSKKTWFQSTSLGNGCDATTHCKDCQPDGDCETCDTIDGRWMEEVAEYAQTCDGCGELHCNENLTEDSKTMLGYCPECVIKKTN